jgi:hypothetical protein
VVDLQPEPEEAYLDEIIFDIIPTEEAFDQSEVRPNGQDAEPLPAPAANDSTAELLQPGETTGIILQTEPEETFHSSMERFSSILFNTDDRNPSNSNYVQARLTPTPVPPNELPEFNTLSGELIEIPETLWNLLDTMNREMSEHRDEDAASDDLVLQSAAISTLTLSAGYVTWLLRAGVLSASLLSSAPLWRQIDPLPVLSARAQRRGTDHEKPSDDDPREKRISKLFEHKNKKSSLNKTGKES